MVRLKSPPRAPAAAIAADPGPQRPQAYGPPTAIATRRIHESLIWALGLLDAYLEPVANAPWNGSANSQAKSKLWPFR